MPPRNSAMPPTYSDIAKKVDTSGLTTESKQIFRLIIELFKSITNERDSEVMQLKQKIEDNRNKAEVKSDDLQQQINNLEKHLVAANSEIHELQKSVNSLKNFQDDQDAYVRRESLIFSGSKVKTVSLNENCVNIARDLVRNVLKVPIDPIISTAHRVGKPPAPNSTRPDNRAIIVRFCQRDDKFAILKTARARNSRVKDLFVNESLTVTRGKIAFVLRQARKMENSPVTGVSTHNGKVFVHSKPSPNAPAGSPSIRTEINTMDKLTDFCTNFIKRPLEAFLNKSENPIESV